VIFGKNHAARLGPLLEGDCSTAALVAGSSFGARIAGNLSSGNPLRDRKGG
jgi:hypothetical protein